MGGLSLAPPPPGVSLSRWPSVPTTPGTSVLGRPHPQGTGDIVPAPPGVSLPPPKVSLPPPPPPRCPCPQDPGDTVPVRPVPAPSA